MLILEVIVNYNYGTITNIFFNKYMQKLIKFWKLNFLKIIWVLVSLKQERRGTTPSELKIGDPILNCGIMESIPKE